MDSVKGKHRYLLHIDPATATVPDQADAAAATPMDEPGQKTGREEERLAAVVPVAKTGTSRESRTDLRQRHREDSRAPN